MSDACKYEEEQLVGLLYEDGDEAEMVEMRAHLATCARCRDELARLASTRDLLAAWPNVVNAPRMVYVNETSRLLARVRRWADEIAGLGLRSVLRPAVAAVAMVLVFVAATALLDMRVAPDGRLRIGFAGGTPAAGPVSDAAITREEFQEGLTQFVSYMEDLFQSRNEEERRLLLAAVDERMQEQGVAVSQQLRGAMDAAFADFQQQHENDLGLVFSAIDELGVVTGTELQRMNAILATLVQPRTGSE